jgi:opacity protein-like surface antigen
MDQSWNMLRDAGKDGVIVMATRLAGIAAILGVVVLPKSALADEPFSWTGFYVGGHAGYNVGYRTTDLPAPFPGAINPEDRYGWLGGSLAGFNYQAGPWVAGIEFDVSLALGDGPRQTVSQPGSEIAWHQYSTNDILATARGRLGYALNRWHLYATGGMAWLQASATIVTTDGDTETGRGSTDATHLGWVAGAGLEFAASSFILRVEYLHHDLGSTEYNYLVPGALTSADVQVDAVRAAIAYKLQ